MKFSGQYLGVLCRARFDHPIEVDTFHLAAQDLKVSCLMKVLSVMLHHCGSDICREIYRLFFFLFVTFCLARCFLDAFQLP